MHPLNNGSQATERPAKKPLSGTAGWFTESGENNVPSYPGQDWFNNNIAEFQAAIAEMGVVFDPQNDDHLAKAFRSINQRLGAKVMGVINVSEIINNSPEFILPITPELGPYVTLEGHGASNFTITGFGDTCPVGYTFLLLIPRTIANTGGAANSLGNYVQFAHTASGDGIDLGINARQTNGSTLYTYQAYPNATDAEGQKCALYEQMQFVHVGLGRWRCVKLPEAIQGRNGNGIYSRSPSGFGNTTVRIDNNPGGQKTYNYPFQFTDTPVPSGNYTSGSDGAVLVSFGVPNQVNVSFSAIISSTGGYLSGTGACSITMVGQWKPNV